MSQPTRLALSLRLSLTLLVLLTALPLFGFILYTSWEERSWLKEKAASDSLKMARNLADHQNEWVRNTHQLLKTISLLPFIQNQDLDTCEAFFSEVQKANPQYLGFLMDDPQGNVIAGNQGKPIVNSDRKFFKDAMRTKDFSVGEYARSRMFQKPALHFALPILQPDKSVKALLIAVFDLSFFGELLMQAQLPPGSVLNLSDTQGICLYRSLDPDTHIGKPDLPELLKDMQGPKECGTFEAVGVDGIHRLNGFCRLKLDPQNPSPPYLYLRVGIPLPQAFQSADNRLQGTLLLASLITILALVGARYFARRFIGQPVQTLVESARSIQAGDLTTRTGLASTHNEIGNLALAIDCMAQSLQEREEQRKVMEQQLLHVQKLESLGVLAGGIAHDFNNILQAIQGNAHLARLEAEHPYKVKAFLQEIEKASSRAADLCRQMLTFAGKRRLTTSTLSLGTLVKDMAKMLQVSISKKVTLTYAIDPALPSIRGDSAQLQQVVMNLITNASDAIGNTQGEIFLSLNSRAYTTEDLKVFPSTVNLPPGTYLQLSVKDTGCGMDADTQRKMFDPFFSTKFAGRGLGLASVQGIIHSHQGAIRVESQPGAGTTIEVLLPLKGSGDPSVPVPIPEEEPWRISSHVLRKGTVLVVDDEEPIRVLCQKYLEKIGFTVLSAANGQQALDLFQQHAKTIDAVVLDFTMPDLSGEEVFAKLVELKSDVRVIICSGYTPHEASKKFDPANLPIFLQKPYAVSNLAEELIQLLGNHT